MHDSLSETQGLLAALPRSKACRISMPGNGMPVYMTIDPSHLSKQLSRWTWFDWVPIIVE